MKRLTWIFELMDRMSGPAKAASASLGGVQAKIEQVSKAGAKAGDGGGFLSRLIGEGGGGIASMVAGMGSVEGVARLVEHAFEKVVDVIAEAGRKVVDL